METYLVGGAVRDELLGLPVKERDWVVVGATPEEMIQQGFKPVGKDFPVFLHPKTKEEYALARTERKVALGYKGFEFYASPEVTLVEDLKRRDLTINAIAKDEHGQLIDPFGGVKDLKQRLLRHVSPAFREDPVRVLRLARFTARFYSLGFKIEPQTILLIQEMVAAKEIDALVPERVLKEFQRALLEKCPVAFFVVLHLGHALERLFPELKPYLDGIASLDDKAIGQVLPSLTRSASMTQQAHVAFAALLFDITVGTRNRRSSSDILKSWQSNYPLPSHYVSIAKQVVRYRHELVAWRQQLPDAEQILELLYVVDAFRQPEKLTDFFEIMHIVQCEQAAGLIKQAFEAALAVKSEPFLAQGLQGEAIGKAIKAARLNAILGRLVG